MATAELVYDIPASQQFGVAAKIEHLRVARSVSGAKDWPVSKVAAAAVSNLLNARSPKEQQAARIQHLAATQSLLFALEAVIEQFPVELSVETSIGDISLEYVLETSIEDFRD